MGSAPFAQEAGRFLIILFANVPMGVCGFGDAIVMHMALTLCGMVRGGGEGGGGVSGWVGRGGKMKAWLEISGERYAFPRST